MLKFVILGLLAVATVQCSDVDARLRSISPKVYEDKINATIESYRQKMITGDPEMGIPSFVPLMMDFVPITLGNSSILNLNINITDLVCSGIPDFIVSYLKFNMIGFTLEANVTLPLTKAQGGYGGDAELFGFIPLYGNGIFQVIIDALDISVKFHIATIDGLVSIDSLNLVIGIGTTDVEFSGLLNDPDASALLSEAITEIIPDFINDRQTWLTTNLSPMISDFINAYVINGMTTDDLLDLLLGTSTTAPPPTTTVA